MLNTFLSKLNFLFLVADVLVSHGFYLLKKKAKPTSIPYRQQFFFMILVILAFVAGPTSIKILIRLYYFCYLPNYFGKSLISMSKVTSLCLTFNQSLDNTIYLRFSFEYLFENFIIVSLHMCISYIFFILFYFSYSSRQIV